MTKVVIYGLGARGKRVASSLIKNSELINTEIVALMDKLGGQYDDICVKKPDKLENLQYDAVIVTSEKWHYQIEQELVNVWNADPEKVVSLSEFMKMIKRDLPGGGYNKLHCNLCRNEAPFGISDGIEADVFREKKIIGGGMRENAICPFCGSGDRERFVQWVLENKTNLYQADGAEILHFAPEKNIEKKLRRHSGYRTADISPTADEIQDITNIRYKSCYFDFIILNHVMEHVIDERKAFSELARCIKPGGKIVFSVPVCWEMPTYEDASVTTDEGRLKAYGQKDHVRLYGNDIRDRLENMGFRVTMYKVGDVPREEAQRMNLIEEDTVWILENSKK